MVVFFDIGGTLGSVRVAASGVEIDRIDVYPEALTVLAGLRGQSTRVGILSNPGAVPHAAALAALQRSELGAEDLFDPALVVFGAKDSSAIFREAAARAGLANTPAVCVFVGEDATERSHATAAGFRVVPHPRLVPNVLAGETLAFVRLDAPAGGDGSGWTAAVERLPLLPVHLAAASPGRLYGIAAGSTRAALAAEGLTVRQLGGDGAPDVGDLYLIRDDRQPPPGFDVGADWSAQFLDDRGDGGLVADRADDGLYVIVPGTRSIEAFHFPDAQHGHSLKLVPDPTLLALAGRHAALWAAPEVGPAYVAPRLDDEDVNVLASLVTADALRAYVDRYSGRASSDGPEGAIRIESRHVLHAQNGVATLVIARDLALAGGGDVRVRLHRFTHEGRTLHNVEGELGGDGATEPAVLVTAHLDSTAASATAFDPAADPAPGADDDASGVAAVMLAARALAELRRRGRLRRVVRFVLFNAEEHGLAGSKAYARDAAAAGTPFGGVFQLDMVGYRGTHDQPPRPFEVHVGYAPSPDVEHRSRALAERVRQARERVAPRLQEPQVYPLTGGGPDPAASRSDHESFQERGYAACAVSEDFFIGPAPASIAPQPNPHYHAPTDVDVDPEYAADIARVVAAAALLVSRE